MLATRRAGSRWLAFLGGAWVMAALGAPASLAAQQGEPPAAEARRPPRPPSMTAGPRTSEIILDGVLDDAAWDGVVPASGFIQREPVEGAPAEEDTEVRVLFDDQAIWIGLRMSDSRPEGIARQLYRRDARGQADYVEVAIDPNLDRRTGYVFSVNAANVQGDRYLYDDERED
ncbi:MAG TPA: carbohydrate binding family 9 domain-containing protein, partial [Longimicrobiales bacterium]|nr:carbohydrate binding family 9 domain-containing protein [Longimicrobiales bacterium]